MYSQEATPARGPCVRSDRMTGRARQHWFLREWRKHRGYTQERLAEMIGTSKAHISNLESGKRQYTQELIELFAEALRCEPADLIVRDPTKPDSIWSIWDQIPASDRPHALRALSAFKKSGTNG